MEDIPKEDIGPTKEHQNGRVYTVSTIALTSCGILANMGYGFGIPFLPQVMIELGGRILYYAFVLAAFQVNRAVFSTQLGKVSDQLGRKPVLIGGLLVFSMSTLVYAILIRTWWHMIIAASLMGIGAGTIWPVAEASLIDQIDPERRGEGMAFYLTASNAGFLLGPAIGGILHHFANQSLQKSFVESSQFVYLFSTVITLVALLIVRILVKETVNPQIIRKNQKRLLRVEVLSPSIEERDLWTPEQQQNIQTLYVVSFTNGVSVGLVTSITPYYLTFVFGIGPQGIGFVFTLSGIFGLIVNLIAGQMADRIGRKPLILVGTGTSRLSTYVLPFSPTIPTVTGFMSLRMLGLNVSMPATRALQSDLIPSPVRGKYFGRLQAFFNVGMVFAPFGGTYLYETYHRKTLAGGLPGYILPFWLSATIGIIALTLFALRVDEPKQKVK
ncbi:MAG: MFS transporter [Candidatus Heimdallarchaeota archaeon]